MDLATALAARRGSTWSWPTTRTPTAAPPPCRTPTAGGCCAATRSVHCSPTTCSPPAHRHLRLLDRLLEPARQDGGRGRPAVRGDADRLQVDQQGRRARVRLRGGAGLLRRPRAREGQGRRLRAAPALRARRPAEGAGAGWSTCSTTWRSRTACTPPTSSPSGSATSAQIAAAMERLRSRPRPAWAGCRSSRSTTWPPVSADLPPTDGLRYRMGSGARVVVRPSGTEPKLKCYLEVVVPVDPEAGVDAARISAAAGSMRCATTSRPPPGSESRPADQGDQERQPASTASAPSSSHAPTAYAPGSRARTPPRTGPRSLGCARSTSARCTIWRLHEVGVVHPLGALAVQLHRSGSRPTCSPGAITWEPPCHRISLRTVLRSDRLMAGQMYLTPAGPHQQVATDCDRVDGGERDRHVLGERPHPQLLGGRRDARSEQRSPDEQAAEGTPQRPRARRRTVSPWRRRGPRRSQP